MPDSKYANLKTRSQVEDRARGPGRPRNGKTSNPDYTPTTVLLEKEQKKQMKMRLLIEEREISDVVGALIDAWLKGKVVV